MKKAKIKENTSKKSNKTNKEAEKFTPKAAVITGIIMLASLVGFYFLTDRIVKNRKPEEEKEKEEIKSIRDERSINYSDIDKIEDKDYYLLLDAGTKKEEEKKEDSKSNTSAETMDYAAEYDQHINYIEYQKLVDEKFYYIDYTKKENKKVFDKKSNLKDLKKLKVKEPTLIYVKDGKISKTYVGNNNILMQMYIMRGYISTSTSASNSNKASNSNTSKKNDSKKSNKKK